MNLVHPMCSGAASLFDEAGSADKAGSVNEAGSADEAGSTDMMDPSEVCQYAADSNDVDLLIRALSSGGHIDEYTFADAMKHSYMSILHYVVRIRDANCWSVGWRRQYTWLAVQYHTLPGIGDLVLEFAGAPMRQLADEQKNYDSEGYDSNEYDTPGVFAQWLIEADRLETQSAINNSFDLFAEKLARKAIAGHCVAPTLE